MRFLFGIIRPLLIIVLAFVVLMPLVFLAFVPGGPAPLISMDYAALTSPAAAVFLWALAFQHSKSDEVIDEPVAWAVLDAAVWNQKLRILMFWMFILGVTTVTLTMTCAQYATSDCSLLLLVANTATWMLALGATASMYKELRFESGHTEAPKS